LSAGDEITKTLSAAATTAPWRTTPSWTVVVAHHSFAALMAVAMDAHR
jgi:hypothetical protein